MVLQGVTFVHGAGCSKRSAETSSSRGTRGRVCTVRGVRELSWIGFNLTRYPTLSNFNGLSLSSNLQFHCQTRLELTRSLMSWVGLRVVFQIKEYIFYDSFCRFYKNVTKLNTILFIYNTQIQWNTSYNI